MTCVIGEYQLEGFGAGAFRVVVELLAQVSDPERELRVVLLQRDVREVELGPAVLFERSLGLLAGQGLH